MSGYDKLHEMAVEGKVSRRDFLATASALGIGAAMGGDFLISEARAQGAPKKGGTLKIGMEGGSASDSYDPRTYADSIMITASLAIMNNLVEIGYDGKATGELFESWEASKDAVTWTFNVRKGIKFSTGKTLDAEDCIYSISLHTGETKSPAKSLLKQIKEIKALNANQVQMVLESGNADLPYVLSDYHIVVVPKGHTDWTKPVGTGAFTLEKFEPGVRIAFKSRGDYWKPNRGNFEAVEILYIQDKVARTAALQSGQIDAANRLDPRTVNLLARDQKLSVVRTKGTGNRYCFVAHHDTAPYNNKDLREALKFGIDRQKIVDTVFGGFATLGNDHTMGPANRYFNAKQAQRPYDPDKAAFHFKKAGITAPIELQASEGAWSSAVDCASLYQESAKKAGVNLNVKKVSADGYWDNVWLKQPFCAVYWGNRPTADIMFSTIFKSDSSWNDSRWKNEEFDKLVVAARAEFDEAKRFEMYGKCQELISAEGGMICFAISDNLDGYVKKVAGVNPHPRYDLADCRLPEVGWFA